MDPANRTAHHLADWGWDAPWQAAWDAMEHAPGQQPGRVVTVQRNICRTVLEGGETDLGLSGGLLREAAAGGLGVAVGDFIAARIAQGGGVIDSVLPRRTQITRADGFSANGAQILCANIDVIFLVQALGYDFNPRRAERYLAAAWDSGAMPIILLNKADTVEDASPWTERVRDAAPGVDVYAVSALSGQGIETLRALCGSHTCAFLGSSGVGKSTLLNALAGAELAATAAVREDDQRGRHTTTYRALHRLPWGGLILDTPGMREFGVRSGGVDAVFSEIAEIAENCRFADCAHRSEPGCAVQAAVREGILDPKRIESYQRILRESRFAQRKERYQHKAAAKAAANLTDKRSQRKEPVPDPEALD